MKKLTILTFFLVLLTACSTEELDFVTNETAIPVEEPALDKK